MISNRTRVRRLPQRGRYDRAAIDEVLDAWFVAHVSFVKREHPFCVPLLYARVGDSLYIHGSSASRAMKTLATGVPACVTVTMIDGLVLARSAFEHSANYRSAMLLGTFRRVDEHDEKIAAFEAFTNKLVRGRWNEVRHPSAKELKAAAILRMTIDEASAKIRTGPPTDDDSPDASIDTWAGVVPILTGFGEPDPSPGLRDGIPLANSVHELLARGR
jgi:nitroimidazol reductase NimA-like FMN-containing flavoprotein (pyridoxamine 5'-phosphate oxidase superfamily)